MEKIQNIPIFLLTFSLGNGILLEERGLRPPLFQGGFYQGQNTMHSVLWNMIGPEQNMFMFDLSWKCRHNTANLRLDDFPCLLDRYDQCAPVFLYADTAHWFDQRTNGAIRYE